MAEDILFKTAFWGFDKKDVMDYIEDIQKENRTVKKELLDLRGQMEVLKLQIEQLKTAEEPVETKEQENAEPKAEEPMPLPEEPMSLPEEPESEEKDTLDVSAPEEKPEPRPLPGVDEEFAKLASEFDAPEPPKKKVVVKVKVKKAK